MLRKSSPFPPSRRLAPTLELGSSPVLNPPAELDHRAIQASAHASTPNFLRHRRSNRPSGDRANSHLALDVWAGVFRPKLLWVRRIGDRSSDAADLDRPCEYSTRRRATPSESAKLNSGVPPHAGGGGCNCSRGHDGRTDDAVRACDWHGPGHRLSRSRRCGNTLESCAWKNVAQCLPGFRRCRRGAIVPCSPWTSLDASDIGRRHRPCCNDRSSRAARPSPEPRGALSDIRREPINGSGCLVVLGAVVISLANPRPASRGSQLVDQGKTDRN